MYVYVKVQMQRVVFTGYKVVGISFFFFGYIILFLYVKVIITKEQNIIIAYRGKWIKNLFIRVIRHI